MRRELKDKLLFELSYLNTTELFALRERISPTMLPEKAERIWESALLKSSNHLRK